MIRDEDEYDEPGYECAVCHRSFRSYARLDDHTGEHETPPQCKNCGKQLRFHEYHRC